MVDVSEAVRISIKIWEKTLQKWMLLSIRVTEVRAERQGAKIRREKYAVISSIQESGMTYIPFERGVTEGAKMLQQ